LRHRGALFWHFSNPFFQPVKGKIFGKLKKRQRRKQKRVKWKGDWLVTSSCHRKIVKIVKILLSVSGRNSCSVFAFDTSLFIPHSSQIFGYIRFKLHSSTIADFCNNNYWNVLFFPLYCYFDWILYKILLLFF